ncbi:chalcone isomerase family protein [Paucibacter sp. PLA-PC-4]|uniref:chalcone isomerase family protein n=1 Tax=Paucibacter sp. PLA-PC-4 TaxID=2993655 RepID=UPI00224B614F|nr:chalcone isomerase family protein [Paucibacter sp. PLA-PC-4]MCX2863963.1 chalcone isomerase family protein [Paucibacter sp. PLA-PC-4]
MDRRLASLALIALPLAAQAQPAELPGWKLQGQGQMRFFGLLVYDIRLWATSRPGPQWWTAPLALELEYARSLKGAEIAKRSLLEMRRQQAIDEATAKRWLVEMEAAFPDVKAGDRISGRHEPEVGADFFVNGALSRRIADPQFSRLFFGIWLAPQTSEPALRTRLLGPGS